MEGRSPFAGGDQAYLRCVQYGDGSKLDVRTTLHRRFSTASHPFPDFVSALIGWSDTARVLECGSGTGRFWENTNTPRSADLTLTDLSPGMVDEAVARATANGFAHVDGQECDVQHLPFDDRSFDVVVANHMLYHVPEPDLAIAEIARVLRDDGIVLAATNGHGHMGTIKDALAEVFGDGRGHGDQLYEVFGIDTGESRMRRQFSMVSWHAYDNDLIVTDPAAVIAYGLSYPPGETATDVEASEFAAAIGRRFLDGRLTVSTRTGAFVCARPRHQ